MVPDALHDISALYDPARAAVPVDVEADQWSWVLPFKTETSLSYVCWQRAIDIAFGLLGVVILLVLLPLLAVLIYLDSPGPIFYSQMRLGHGRKAFRMYKLRSMHCDAESGGCELWASANDPRVTRIGRLLRATHMDELPQVVNILRGDMSLIGPRPEREAFATEMEKIEPLYRCRLAVKPGLTGWAQVMYGYGGLHQRELQKLQYDLYYIMHCSCTLDMAIILRTVVEVVFCHGR